MEEKPTMSASASSSAMAVMSEVLNLAFADGNKCVVKEYRLPTGTKNISVSGFIFLAIEAIRLKPSAVIPASMETNLTLI